MAGALLHAGRKVVTRPESQLPMSSKSTSLERVSSRRALRAAGVCLLLGLGVVSGTAGVPLAEAQVAAKLQPTGFGCPQDYDLKIVGNVLTCERKASAQVKTVVATAALICDRGTLKAVAGYDQCGGSKPRCPSGEWVIDHAGTTDMCVTYKVSPLDYKAPTAI